MKELVLALGIFAAVGTTAADRKMVSFGWEWHRNSAKELLALQPQVAAAGYDGVGIDLRFPHRDGTNTVYWGTTRGIMEQPDWTWDELADFQKLTKLDGFRECFVSGYRVPAKRFSWTDDASWGRINRFPDPIWWNPTYDEKMPGFNRAIKAIKNLERF